MWGGACAAVSALPAYSKECMRGSRSERCLTACSQGSSKHLRHRRSNVLLMGVSRPNNMLLHSTIREACHTQWYHCRLLSHCQEKSTQCHPHRQAGGRNLKLQGASAPKVAQHNCMPESQSCREATHAWVLQATHTRSLAHDMLCSAVLSCKEAAVLQLTLATTSAAVRHTRLCFCMPPQSASSSHPLMGTL
jgi:hypothetical protein